MEYLSLQHLRFFHASKCKNLCYSKLSDMEVCSPFSSTVVFSHCLFVLTGFLKGLTLIMTPTAHSYALLYFLLYYSIFPFSVFQRNCCCLRTTGRFTLLVHVRTELHRNILCVFLLGKLEPR